MKVQKLNWRAEHLQFHSQRLENIEISVHRRKCHLSYHFILSLYFRRFLKILYYNDEAHLPSTKMRKSEKKRREGLHHM